MSEKNVFVPLLRALAFGAFLWTVSGAAASATYNILFKEANAPLACATGSFTFTKTVAGTFSAPATVNVAAGCSTLAQGSYSGSVTVTVEAVVSSTGDDQGPNVRGISGTLPGNGQASISFQYVASSGTHLPGARTFSSTLNSGQTGLSGTYYPSSVGTLPEPEMLALLLAGLGLLYGVRRLRRV